MNSKADIEIIPSIKKKMYDTHFMVEKEEILVLKNRETPVPDIEKIEKHFERAKKILARDYLILRYNEGQPSLMDFLNNFEKELIQFALLFSSGVQKQAAELLGVKPTCLFEKIKRFGLKHEKPIPLENRKALLSELGLFLVDLQRSLY